jgi:hypothetical protein
MSRPAERDDTSSPEELDLTEDEFDAKFAAAEPVIVVAHAPLRKHMEDYYTLQMSDSTILTSAGRWGEGRLSTDDQETPLVSYA